MGSSSVTVYFGRKRKRGRTKGRNTNQPPLPTLLPQPVFTGTQTREHKHKHPSRAHRHPSSPIGAINQGATAAFPPNSPFLSVCRRDNPSAAENTGDQLMEQPEQRTRLHPHFRTRELEAAITGKHRCHAVILRAAMMMICGPRSSRVGLTGTAEWKKLSLRAFVERTASC